MKLKDAVEIAKACGLTTIGEAVFNIKFHAMCIFEYGKEVEEYKELIEECKQCGYVSETKLSEIEV